MGDVAQGPLLALRFFDQANSEGPLALRLFPGPALAPCGSSVAGADLAVQVCVAKEHVQTHVADLEGLR